MPSQWPLDHVGEALVGFETLPFETGAPVVEEAPSPALVSVVPELSEGLLEQVGGIEPLVGGEQQLERPLALEAEVLMARQQGVFVALDEAPVLAAETGVFGLAHLVERLAEMAHDVELVEQDRRLRRGGHRGVAERLPHVHHRQTKAVALLAAQPSIELRHAGLRPVLTAEPDRPLALQVADHDAIAVALADRDLVDADRLRPRPPGTRQLRLHVLLLQRLDRLPVEPQLLGHVADAPLLPIIMASHTRFLTVPFAQVRGDHRPEMDDPAPDGLVRD